MSPSHHGGDGTSSAERVFPFSGAECSVDGELVEEFFWPETSLPWVLPSPNMPTPDTAAVYPGMVLLEATNMSEGRGTTRPLKLSAHPTSG